MRNGLMSRMKSTTVPQSLAREITHPAGGTMCIHHRYRPNRISRCADEYAQSCGFSTRPCFTGFHQQWRTCAAKSASFRICRSRNRRCHIPRSCRGSWLGRSGPAGIPRENRALISRHRDEVSASPSGKVQSACRWSGRTTQAPAAEARLGWSITSRSFRFALSQILPPDASPARHLAPPLPARRLPPPSVGEGWGGGLPGHPIPNP